MMNVFGGSTRLAKGPRGPRGFPGADAVELRNYLPNTISKGLRENEQQESFVLTSKNDVELDHNGNVQKWKNKRIKREKDDLDAVKASKIIEIPLHADKYALQFPGVYANNSFELFDADCVYGYLCITFRTDSDALQTLLTSTSKLIAMGYHEIEVTSSDITISASINDKKASETIVCNTKEWTTLYLQWEFTDQGPDVYDAKFTYLINNDQRGSFTFQQHYDYMYGVCIGDRPTIWRQKSQPFSGHVHAIERYHTDHPIPEVIRNLVITKQMITDE